MSSLPPTPSIEAPPPEPPPAPPSVADGVERRLDPRSIAVERIGGWIFFGLLGMAQLGAIVTVCLLSAIPLLVKGALLGLVAPALLAGIVWVAHFWPVIAHRHAAYRVDEEGIEIKRGVVWRYIINVPRSRVQHTDVSQGPIERSYGLGTLVIYTAGTEHAKVQLHGLDHSVALRIRDHLLQTGAGDVV